MTQEEIEHMWKVASNNPHYDTNWHDPIVVAFAKLVAEAEREACAKLVDHILKEGGGTWGDAIRARGEQA